MADPELLQNVDDGRNVKVDIRGARIDDMQQQVGIAQFLKSGAKGGQQFLGQIADESNGIGDDHLPTAWESATGGWSYERLEYPVFCRHMAIGQHIEQSGFAGVGIADQRHDRNCMFLPESTSLILLPGKRGALALKVRDPTDKPAVGFQLRLSRPARLNASA